MVIGLERQPHYYIHMKKAVIFLLIVLVLLLGIAFATKPDDKTCKIVAVKSVWGSVTPDYDTMPEYYEQFMDVTSKAVEVEDLVFLKRIRYRFNEGTRTIGYGAFGRVMIPG